MNITPFLQRLGLVLIGLGLVMGPIADPAAVTVVYSTAAFLLAYCFAADLIFAGRDGGLLARLLRTSWAGRSRQGG